ncbi:hypothetical protein [Pandoravirus japonicus]|uniref:Uncharacterized protein n=1 Tax=Pandoravirus japonicus TaxID=2823154 RepID=A0A811BRQ7_9VIRU|nr:hypothetical protein [Pandoravirus japonicus]
MLISSAGSRQGHDGSRRQPAAIPRAQPQPQQQPRQEIPQQGHATRPARIALVDPDRGRHGGQHPVPTPDRHQSRGPPIDRAREIASRQDDHDRREEDSSSDDDDDDDDDDEIDEDESYEDEEGADEYRHQFDYNGARSTVEPVQDDEPVYQVRCPAPRHNAHVNSSDDNHDGAGQAEDEEGGDDSSDSASSQEGTVSSDDDSDDDDGYGTLIALCSGWRSARIKVDALSAAAKTLRHERKDLAKRLIDHMSRRKIAGEDAFGSLPGDWRAKVTIVRAPTSCSVSDQVLSAAVHKRLSVQMAHDCALAEANKAAKKEKKCSPNGAKKRAPPARCRRRRPSTRVAHHRRLRCLSRDRHRPRLTVRSDSTTTTTAAAMMMMMLVKAPRGAPTTPFHPTLPAKTAAAATTARKKKTMTTTRLGSFAVSLWPRRSAPRWPRHDARPRRRSPSRASRSMSSPTPQPRPPESTNPFSSP